MNLLFKKKKRKSKTQRKLYIPLFNLAELLGEFRNHSQFLRLVHPMDNTKVENPRWVGTAMLGKALHILVLPLFL